MLSIDEEIAAKQHTRESLFALLDLALPHDELEDTPENRWSGDRSYTMTYKTKRYLMLGQTRFMIEDHIVKHLGIPIGVAEKLALEYAVLREYAVELDGFGHARRSRYHGAQ